MKMFILFTMFLSSIALADVGPVGRGSILKYDGTVDTAAVEKWFINVKNTSGGTLAAGAVMTPDLSEDDGVSFTTSATAGYSPMCILAESCADDKLCQCQTYGIFDAALFDVTAASAVAGKRWFMSTQNAGYIAARVTDLATEVPGGIFYDAASASGTVQVFINLR